MPVAQSTRTVTLLANDDQGQHNSTVIVKLTAQVDGQSEVVQNYFDDRSSPDNERSRHEMRIVNSNGQPLANLAFRLRARIQSTDLNDTVSADKSSTMDPPPTSDEVFFSRQPEAEFSRIFSQSVLNNNQVVAQHMVALDVRAKGRGGQRDALLAIVSDAPDHLVLNYSVQEGSTNVSSGQLTMDITVNVGSGASLGPASLDDDVD